MIEVVRHAGPGAFLHRAEGWLLEAEDRHNLILGLAYGLAAGALEGRPSEPDRFFSTVEIDGSVHGSVLRTPPHKVLMTDLPEGAAAPLVARLSELYDDIPAVLGPTGPAEAVAMAWVERHGGGWRPGMEQRIYRLDEVVPPRGVPGRLRLADSDDLKLAVEWGDGFARDTGVQFSVEEETVRRWIEGGELFVWDDDGPRSITVAHGHTPNGVRIGYVYTPPEVRGRGYASACVAGVSQAQLDDGVSFCVLYTDLSNPTSNAIYRRIGYRPIVDVRDFDVIAEGKT